MNQTVSAITESVEMRLKTAAMMLMRPQYVENEVRKWEAENQTKAKNISLKSTCSLHYRGEMEVYNFNLAISLSR